MTRQVLLASLLAVFISTPLSAKEAFNVWNGVEMVTLNVKGHEYRFPAGDRERKESIYWLKKALKGDKDALEMFLGDAKEKMFYIGTDSPLWLKVTRNTVEVIKPGERHGG